MKKRYLFIVAVFVFIISFSTAIVPNYNILTKVDAVSTVATEEQVRLVQQRLKTWGYFDGPITGYYEELTKAAVIKLQKKHIRQYL